MEVPQRLIDGTYDGGFDEIARPLPLGEYSGRLANRRKRRAHLGIRHTHERFFMPIQSRLADPNATLPVSQLDEYPLCYGRDLGHV
jgi:hypothetical protein